jgi:CPA1 family monovalent cation:H+ antiporter
MRHPRFLTFVSLIIVSAGILSGCAPVQTDLDLPSQISNPAFSIDTGNESQGTPTAESAFAEEEHTADELLEDSEEQILIAEEIIIGLLFVAVLVGIVAHRLRVPYTIGLVVIGLVLTLQTRIEISISPNLILALLVPPLVFEAAFHLNFNDLRFNLGPILALAVPGVILTTVIVGVIVTYGTGLVLPVALVFGALVSATDPVSVVALFRSMGVPKRLQVLLEGESLFNDGTAIVLFDLVLAMALAGMQSFNLISGLLDFIRVAGGGLIVGVVLGTMISQIISRIDDHLIETTLTSVLAYGAYLISEHLLGFSGVLAVVAAGLVNGNIGPRGMSPTTRIVVFNFWEYAAFVANSFIFLLIGLRIELPLLFTNWPLILWAIIAVLVARAVGVYGLSRLGADIPSKWQHVLYWGGLRGAISLALALSLPDSLGSSNEIQVMAFGVVLFTLVVQGMTMSPLVRRLGLIERSEMQDEYERRHARAVSARAAYEHLAKRNQEGLLSDHVWRILEPLLREHSEGLADTVREVLTAYPSVEAEELDIARRETLRAQRSALSGLRRDGIISDEIYGDLVGEVDAALTQQTIGWPDLLGSQTIRQSTIDRLMLAVVQEEDLESAFSMLNKLGFSVTRLNTSGGFLRRRNVTLMIGLSQGHEEAVVKALKQSCRERVQYLDAMLPGTVSSIPVKVTVGGATIFTFEVELAT